MCCTLRDMLGNEGPFYLGPSRPGTSSASLNTDGKVRGISSHHRGLKRASLNHRAGIRTKFVRSDRVPLFNFGRNAPVGTVFRRERALLKLRLAPFHRFKSGVLALIQGARNRRLRNR